MNVRDESGRHDPDLLREALKRRLNKPDHPFPPIKGCENDRLVCAMAVVVLSPFLIKQINESKLSVSGLIRDLGQRMRKFICQQGAELADWVNRHIANGNTDEEVVRVMIILEKIAPTIIPLYFTSEGKHLRRFGKKMFTLNEQEFEGAVFRRDAVKMKLDEESGEWVMDRSCVDDTAWLFQGLPADVEAELDQRRRDFDSYFGRDDISGEWAALPSSSPTGDMPLVVANDDGTVGDTHAVLDSLFAEEERGSDGQVDPVDVTDTEVVDLFGDEEEKPEDSLEEASPEEREAILEAARQEDEPIDPALQAELEARLKEEEAERLRRAKEHKRKRDFEEGPGQILKQLTESGVDPSASSARLRRVSDEGVVEEPLQVEGPPQTITRAVARLGPEEEEPTSTGGDTRVIDPGSRMNFDTLTGDPGPRTITRDMGTKGKPPALEEEGGESDPSLLEEEEQADPPEVGGEDPAHALTHTSIRFDKTTEQKAKEAQVTQDNKKSDDLLRGRKITFNEDGDAVISRGEIVEWPLSYFTDPTKSFNILGQELDRRLFECDNPDDRYIPYIVLRTDPDQLLEHEFAVQSGIFSNEGDTPDEEETDDSDPMFDSQAPGSGSDVEGSYDPDDEDFELEGDPDDAPSAFRSASSFLGDEEEDEDLEVDNSQFDTGETTAQQGEGSSDTTPALPGTVASTEPPFSGNKDEDLSQGGADLTQNDTKSEGHKPDGNKPKEEDTMSKDENKEPDTKPDETKDIASKPDTKPEKTKPEGDKPTSDDSASKDTKPKKDKKSKGKKKSKKKGKKKDKKSKASDTKPDTTDKSDSKSDEDQTPRLAPAPTMTVRENNATPEVRRIEVITCDSRGQDIKMEKVNDKHVRCPRDHMDGAKLNEQGELFTFSDGGEPGVRAILVNDAGEPIGSAFAPNSEAGRNMLNNNEGHNDHAPPSWRERAKAKAGALRDWAWSNQGNGQRALRTGLPVLLLLILAGVGIWKYNQSPEQLALIEQNWAPTRGSQEIAKGYRDLESHEGLREDLVFPWPGEEHKGALTEANVKQVIRPMPQYDQDWRDDIRGFHFAYTVDDTFCNKIAGRYGLDHPIWDMGLPMSQFTVVKNVAHRGTAPARMISVTPAISKTDRIAVVQYHITVSPAYQLELDKAEAISPEAYNKALPRVLFSRFHAPRRKPRITSN